MKYQKLFIVLLVLGLLAPLVIISLDLSGIINSSENDMTAASFVYVPLAFFGLAGLLLSKRFLNNTRKLFIVSFLYGLLSFLLLILFYGIIWPML